MRVNSSLRLTRRSLHDPHLVPSARSTTGPAAPVASGIHLNDLFTVFLNGSGGIESVVNGTGTAVSPTNGGPSDLVSAS